MAVVVVSGIVGLALAVLVGLALADDPSAEPPGSTAQRVPETTIPAGTSVEPAAEPNPDSPPSDDATSTGNEARTEVGAVAAAMQVATASQSWVYLADADVEAAATEVVATSARDRLVPEVVDDVRLLRDQLDEAKGTVWYVVSPLATKLDTYSPDRAVVRVWVVRVLSADGVAVPQSGWETLTIHLTWEDGSWRAGALDRAEGPVPQLESGLQAWSAAYLDRTLAGFVRVATL